MVVLLALALQECAVDPDMSCGEAYGALAGCVDDFDAREPQKPPREFCRMFRKWQRDPDGYSVSRAAVRL